MNTETLQRTYRSMQLQRNLMAAVAAVGFGIVAIQSIALAKQKRSVVLIPSTVSDGMVAYGARDTRYIEALALDTIYALFNVSEASMQYSRTVLERVTSAVQRQEVLRAWEESNEDYVRRKISTTYLPGTIQYQLELDRVLVTGALRTFIGNTMVSHEEKIVAVYFTQEAGSYRVSGIEEINSEEDQ